MTADYPLVSIITIDFNQFQITREFLKSLNKLSYPNFEVILIDNASEIDNSSATLSEFPTIKLVRTKKNLGFSGGNNLGMKLAKGDYFLILNNDTEITEADFIEKLLLPFKEDAIVGMVSPKIRYFDSPDVIQFAGYNRINSLTGRNSQVGDGEIDRGQYNKSGYTHYAFGAAMMVKREVSEKVGIFADQFFLCYEELDWSAQTIKAGYAIYYQAQTFILHKESMTIGKTSPLKVYFNNRNRLLFMRRNSNAATRFFFFLYYAVFTVPKNVFTFLVRFQFKHLGSFLDGIFWNIRNLNLYSNKSFQTRLEDVSLDVIQKID